MIIQLQINICTNRCITSDGVAVHLYKQHWWLSDWVGQIVKIIVIYTIKYEINNYTQSTFNTGRTHGLEQQKR